jgi:hypothetical protein
MDDNNQTNPKEVAENTDLAKQYQQILDQYSQELAKTEPAPAPVTQTPPEPELSKDLPLTEAPPAPPEPPEEAPASESEILPPPPVEPELSPAPEPEILPPPPIVSEISAEPEIPVTSESSLPPKSSGNFFKFLFFISLIIFLGVCGAILFTVISTKQNSASTITPTPETVVPIVSANSCQLNDQTYSVGQSFPAADGCNTCTCQTDLTISCTQKACEATPSVSLVPTKTATSSAKITPTKVITTPTVTPIADSGPLSTILTSINTQLKSSYKEITLDNGKTWSVNLTKSYSKANVTVMEKAITDFGLMLQADLSGVSGSDWKNVYAKTADTCTLQYLQSVLTLSCGN